MSARMIRARAFVRWSHQNALRVWLVALLLAVPATWRTVALYTHLHADFEELLPKDAPSVVALEELRARAPGLQHLGVIVDVGEATNLTAGEALLDDLAVKIRAYPPDLVSAVRLGTSEERAFLESHAPLYVALDDLKAVRARVEARRDWEVAKASGGLLDDSESPPSLEVSDILDKYKQATASKMPVGRFSSEKLHLTLLLVEVGGTAGGASKSKVLLDRVKSDVEALGGTEAYGPGMRLGYTADVATTVEETEGLMADLSVSSVFVLLAVGAVVALYFRWLRSLAVLLPPLLLATVYAFAVASLPPFRVTTLNSNTAFLGSIIVGNGINFGIILLARYVEERRRAVDPETAMATAVDGTLPSTLTAALAASAAYGALALTQFQGFRQFGYVGGVGMVLAWLTAFILVPPLAMKLDGGRIAPRASASTAALMGPLTRFIARFALPLAVLSLGVTGVAAWTARGFDRSHLETDISKLRRADTWTDGEGYWGRRMDALLGEYLTPIAILTDSPHEARAVADHLRATKEDGALRGQVAHVRTLDDVVPLDQAAKLDEVRLLRADMTPNVRSLLTGEQRANVDRFLGPAELSTFTASDVPRTLTTGLREYDGAADGSTVLVYPQLTGALWEGHALGGFVDALRARAAEVGARRPPRVAGSLPLTSDILTNVEHDGPRVTLLAFLGVVVVVVALFRWRRTTVYVLVSLLVGVLWLFAATLCFGVKINFANFIAFPITFGIGVDYSVNVVSRYVADRDILGAVRSTGAAVGLCSLTTILGYSSLLLAQNLALYLFGLLAVLGEIACLTTALVVLPAVLLAVQRVRGTPVASAADESQDLT